MPMPRPSLPRGPPDPHNPFPATTEFVVAFVLKREKAKKHVNEKLLEAARCANIRIVVLDESCDLDAQGPLNVILHKIRRPEWEQQLAAYVGRHPGVRVVDPPLATHPLRNRGLMLTPFAGPGLALVCEAPAGAAPGGPARVRCRVPAQLVLEAGAGLEAARARLGAAGIQLPLLAKSLWADGGAASHSMAAVANYAGLRQLVEGEAPPGLAPPVLVQQYVDHGTCLFKVYVLGEDAVCVTRPSLRLGADAAQQATQSSTDLNSSGATRIGDSPPEEPASAAAAPAAAAAPGLQLVPRVSAYPRSRPWGREDLAPPGHGVAPPPEWAWRQLARRLRHTLGLELFNFDLIVPAAGVAGGGGSAQGAAGEVMDVYLIDINYFPGYEKLAGYEELMVRFLRGLRPGGSGG